ncbi:pseudouridine synthase, RluA family protein [Candidatus Phytoplasma oryzae]|uniref:Pseudouridine synthase n=1 Tax=Candidatus Phytoplasma oryzae TaxID=203274 RepID=A0A139JQW9_9MOLU|nr:RluA family pseudouridine synthase [Candidatus Phytoplasma oryzae]KXT29362.1 pseudouridine synthase, RluA family protein [Candidatus Phytoplasma oryzae]RAM57947.1 pseudouridylate synthase [Candidatus Phytoplasma oryzae]
MKKILFTEKEIKTRLDTFLSKKLDLSRNKCNHLINSGEIKVNNSTKKKNYILKTNDLIFLNINIKKESNSIKNIKPINLNLQIIYEDNFLALINKPCNLIVHPSSSYSGITLINGLLFQIKKTKKIKSHRPGIIHRLDKDTTGLILIGKEEKIISKMKKFMQQKKIKRIYWALIHGFLAKEGIIDLPIKRDKKNRLKMSVASEGKPSITHFKTLKKFKKFSLLELELETGRTHQIRVHLSYLKKPIVGDLVYGKKEKTIKKQLLHAKKISFVHPVTEKYLKFEIDLPDLFKKTLEDLENSI